MKDSQFYSIIISIFNIIFTLAVTIFFAIKQLKHSKEIRKLQTEQLTISHEQLNINQKQFELNQTVAALQHTRYIEQSMPYPKIVKVELFKKTPESAEDHPYHRRYKYGLFKPEHDLPDNECLELTDRQTIDELKSHFNKSYFTKNAQGIDCLVLNFLKEMDKFVIYENPNTLITLLNTGTPYKYMILDATRITYTVNGTVITLKGAEGHFINGIDGSDKQELYFCEATNNFNNSVCAMENSVYKEIKKETNILKERFNEFEYFLNYTKLEFFVTVINDKDCEFYYKIYLEKVGNQIRPDTKPLKTRADLDS